MLRREIWVCGIAIAVALSLMPDASYGDPFVNLDFEQATVPPGTQLYS